MCGAQKMLITDRYIYLGITRNEFLDYHVIYTAKAVAQRASPALCLLIAKFKCMGGMPYNVFTKLYDAIVWPVKNYGACV